MRKEAACKYDEQAALLNKPVNFPQHEGQEQAVKQAPMRDLSKVPDATEAIQIRGSELVKQEKSGELRSGSMARSSSWAASTTRRRPRASTTSKPPLNKPVNFPQHEGQEQAVKPAPYRKDRSKVPDATRPSNFVGVSWMKQKKQWQVQIRIDGKRKNPGATSTTRRRPRASTTSKPPSSTSP